VRKTASLAHCFLAEVITADDVVVDATMGNGYDTEFLAKLCKNVIAFDVQEEAVAATQARLKASGSSATLIKDGHENVGSYVSTPVKAAIFNLGFLPGSDKRVITLPDTTVTALEKIMKLLVPRGRIAVTVYPGHGGGKAESDAVVGLIGGLDESKWRVSVHQSEYPSDTSPYIICVEKL